MNTQAKIHQAGFTLIEYIMALVVAAIVAAMVYTYMGSALTKSSEPIFRLQKASNLQLVMENIVADYNRLNALNLRYKWKASTSYPVNRVVVPTTNNGHYYRRVVATGTGISGTSEPTWPTATGGTVGDGGVTWTESGLARNNSTAYAVNNIVVPVINNGHYYRCTVAGTSGTTVPTWPVTNAGTVADGGVTWTEAGTVLNSTYITDNLNNYLTTSPARYGTGFTVVAADTKFIQFNASTEVDAGTSGTSSERNILKVTIKNNDSGETLTELFTIH